MLDKTAESGTVTLPRWLWDWIDALVEARAFDSNRSAVFRDLLMADPDVQALVAAHSVEPQR